MEGRHVGINRLGHFILSSHIALPACLAPPIYIYPGSRPPSLFRGAMIYFSFLRKVQLGENESLLPLSPPLRPPSSLLALSVRTSHPTAEKEERKEGEKTFGNTFRRREIEKETGKKEEEERKEPESLFSSRSKLTGCNSPPPISFL